MLYSQRKYIEWEMNKNPPPNIDGRKMVDEKGYVKIYFPASASNKKGYIYEHRLVIEMHLNRRLQPWESVHHINEIKIDNRIENLFLTTPSEHTALHREGKAQSLRRRTHMRNKTRKRRRNQEIRKRDSRGRYV